MSNRDNKKKKAKKKHTEQRLREYYDHLAKMVYERLLAREPSLKIGRDQVHSPPYYRRIDCDGRALVYFKPRPRKRWLRIELTSLWEVAATTTLAVRTSTGIALLIDKGDEIEEAVEFLLMAIQYTREVRHDWVRPYFKKNLPWSTKVPQELAKGQGQRALDEEEKDSRDGDEDLPTPEIKGGRESEAIQWLEQREASLSEGVDEETPLERADRETDKDWESE